MAASTLDDSISPVRQEKKAFEYTIETIIDLQSKLENLGNHNSRSNIRIYEIPT